MAEKIDLYEALRKFINKKCSNINNKDFIINYHPNNSNKDNLKILYDDNNSIKCFLNKKDELNKNEKDLKLLIKDSSFELVIYKTDTDLNIIKCILLLIVNDYSIIEKEEPNKYEEETFMDINNDEEIVEKLKIFLFNYIKDKNNKNKELSVDTILLNNSSNNIRFFDKKEIKNCDNIIKACDSNIQINNKYSIKIILDELNPKFKESLMDKYLDEMPEEIVNLMKKYKKVTFNNDMYMNYLNTKNNQENDKKSENKEKDQLEDENEKENNEENKDLMSPIKKEKKEKKKKDEKNGNLSSDKKQLFKIK